MIDINLLPLSLRKRKRKWKLELPPVIFMAVGGGILVLLLLTSVGLAIGIGGKKGKLQRVKEELEQVKTESEKVAVLKEEKDKLKKRMSIIEQLMDRRIVWAKKINQLSNLIPPQVWLTSLSVEERSEDVDSGQEKENVSSGQKEKEVGSDQEKTEKITRRFLVIKGVTASTVGEAGGLKLVGDFMDRLRNDSSFYEDFVNVQQEGSLRWGRSGGLEVMYFVLSCQFKEKE